MKTFPTGVLAVDQGVVVLSSDFDTGGELWSSQGPRERRIDVSFSSEFQVAPAVHLSLSMFDMDHSHNQRFDLEAEEITKTGFVIAFRTWADTKIARARASWLAVGTVPHADDWSVD